VLPLGRDSGRVGVVGPYAEARHVLGGWSCLGEDADALPLAAALAERIGAERVQAATGCDVEGDRLDLGEVAAVVGASDVVVLAVGEHHDMSGEAGARAAIGLPGRQRELCEAVLASGKPCVALLFNGRPMDISFLAERAPAILEAWFPGAEGTQAAADLLFGDAEPRGRLCMSIPRAVGQLPLYYNRFRTGRPRVGNSEDYFKHGYQDLSVEPLYPFGHGLSYTTFAYDGFALDRASIGSGGTVTASVTVTNTGSRGGHELVLVYVCDVVGSVVRPVRELKGFEWVALEPGESARVSIPVTEARLRFHDAALRYVSEPGLFTITLGGAGEALGAREFRLEPA
jgi:beta-glucosidase